MRRGPLQGVKVMQTVDLLKVLADQTRLQIMLLLSLEDELCVCELVAALDESQPKISRHLRILKDAQLIADRRQGQWMFYARHPKTPGWVGDLLNQLSLQEQSELWHQRARVEQMASRPQRCL